VLPPPTASTPVVVAPPPHAPARAETLPRVVIVPGGSLRVERPQLSPQQSQAPPVRGPEVARILVPQRIEVAPLPPRPMPEQGPARPWEYNAGG
jgi:hypothetical protein